MSNNLFGDIENEREKEWKGMPEFIQNKKQPFAQIIFRFDSAEDLQEFSKLVGQKFTKKSKSAWFPFRSHWGLEKKVYIDEP